LYKFVQCWFFVTHTGVIEGWFDDTLAYSKRYDRYDFPGNCLVVIFGGAGPLKRSFGLVFLWRLTKLTHLMVVVYFYTLIQRLRYWLLFYLPQDPVAGFP